jgi:hypothetical protein
MNVNSSTYAFVSGTAAACAGPAGAGVCLISSYGSFYSGSPGGVDGTFGVQCTLGACWGVLGGVQASMPSLYPQWSYFAPPYFMASIDDVDCDILSDIQDNGDGLFVAEVDPGVLTCGCDYTMAFTFILKPRMSI